MAQRVISNIFCSLNFIEVFKVQQLILLSFFSFFSFLNKRPRWGQEAGSRHKFLFGLKEYWSIVLKSKKVYNEAGMKQILERIYQEDNM